MWQRSGRPHLLSYEEALFGLQNSNRKGFAGFHDLRLPTIPELLPVLEPKQEKDGRSINPAFDFIPADYGSADI
jgi:hypothetical protein